MNTITPPLLTSLLLVAVLVPDARSTPQSCPSMDLNVPLGTQLLGTTDPLAIPARVSLRSDGEQIAPIGGARNNSHADVSLAGNLVAWVTATRSVVMGQYNTGGDQIYVRDIAAATTVLVSEAQVGINLGKPATGNSCLPRFTGNDGVVFQSTAQDLVVGDLGFQDIFEWDLATGSITLLSKRVDNGVQADGGSHGVAASEDGRFLSFTSAARNLMSTAGPTHPYSDCPTFQLAATHTAPKVYLLDQGDAPTPASITLLSVGRMDDGTCTDPLALNAGSDAATVSANGCRVTFQSQVDNLVANRSISGRQIYVWEQATGLVRLVSHVHGAPLTESTVSVGQVNCQNPCISADGRWVVYRSNANDLLPTVEQEEDDDEIYVTDLDGDPLTEQVTVRIDLNPDGDVVTQGGGFRGPSISPDGRWVIVTSGNPDYNKLNAATSPNLTEVLIHDRDADGDHVYDEPFPDSETQFLSLEDPAINAGVFADGLSAPPVRFSRVLTDAVTGAMEQLVIFETEAENLNAGMSPVDDNDVCASCGRDIYIRRVWRTVP